MCNREVTLADVLHKPILPLIIEFTPWPPPGAMALIMSSIVYIDLCGKCADASLASQSSEKFSSTGVGSHSGIGKLQDTETRFREILDRVSRYISGYSDMPVVSSRYLQLPDLFNSRRSEPGPSVPMNSVLVRQASEARSLSPPVDSEQERRTPLERPNRVDDHVVSSAVSSASSLLWAYRAVVGYALHMFVQTLNNARLRVPVKMPLRTALPKRLLFPSPAGHRAALRGRHHLWG